MTETSKRILQEFSGLVFPVWAWVNGVWDRGPHDLWIDGQATASRFYPEWVDLYSLVTGHIFGAIGGYNAMTIMVDEKGEFWGDYAGEYGWLAPTF